MDTEIFLEDVEATLDRVWNKTDKHSLPWALLAAAWAYSDARQYEAADLTLLLWEQSLKLPLEVLCSDP